MIKPLRPGHRVRGRYRVERALGGGGQGVVALGQDERTGRRVAIKRVPLERRGQPDGAARRRLQAELSARVDHPGVLSPIDGGPEGAVGHMIMPYAAAPDLGALIDRGRRLGPRVVASLLKEVAGLLDAVHRHGVIHRDVKPENILVHRSPLRFYLIDFGICRPRGVEFLTRPLPIGTFPYMPREQAVDARATDPRSDLAALGVVAYQLLTDRFPYEGEDAASLIASIDRGPPPAPRRLNPEVPGRLDEACMTLLARRPADRFANAAELRRFLDGDRRNAGRPESRCAVCGRHAESDASFCAGCGAPRPTGNQRQARCLACGAPAASRGRCPGCGRSFPAQDYRLAFTGRRLSGAVLRAPEGRYTVGRDQLAPGDAYLSRRQFNITCDGTGLCISDAGAKNATRIDGVPLIGRVRLSPSSRVAVAGCHAHLQTHEPGATP